MTCAGVLLVADQEGQEPLMSSVLRALIACLLLSPGLSAQTTMVVVQKGDDSLGFYDAESGRRLTRVAVGTKPHELALSADGRTAYVTLYGIDRYTEDAEGGHALAIVDMAGRKKVGEIDLGRHHRPHSIERGRSGRLYVTCDRPPSLLVVDMSVDAAEVVSSIALTQELPHMVEVTPDERTAYVANSGSGSVSVVSLGLDKETRTIAIGGVPMGLALSSDGRQLYAANRTGDAVAVIDTGTAEVVGWVAIPGNPARVRPTPDGEFLLVSLIEAGDVAVVDTGTLRVVHRFHAGGRAEGLTIDPAGRYGYVSAGDDDTVVRFTLGNWKPVRAIKTARKPDPIVILDRGRAPDDRDAGDQPLPPSTFSPRVAPVSEGWDLDPFYKKHVSVRGLPVLGSQKVSDYALKEAAYLIDRMLARRPDLLDALVRDKVRVVVMAHSERTTDVPEHRDMTPKDFWDVRARGLGASRARPIVSCAEENLLNYPGDPYRGENILIHEFAHAIHGLALRRVDPTFDARLQKAYAAALGRGLWRGIYAGSSAGEYWAEAVQSWFDTNLAPPDFQHNAVQSWFDTNLAPPDFQHNDVNIREELEAYDPGVAALVAEVFGATPWRYIPPRSRTDIEAGHLAGFDPGRSPTFTWGAAQKTYDEVVAQKRRLRKRELEQPVLPDRKEDPN
jgi:YVTN family beta-propeller protein